MPAKGREVDLDREASIKGPSKASRPPLLLCDRLGEGESLIWWSRGSGGALGYPHGFLAILLVLMGIYGFVSMPVQEGLVQEGLETFRLLSLFPPILLAGFFLLPPLVRGAQDEIYGLTQQRVIYVGVFPYLFFSVGGGDRRNSGASLMLRVTGNRERGNIRLRGILSELTWFSHRPQLRLSGIERPLEIARLIKSTLNLDLPIEDRTR
jgi:hypothetical protein